MKFGRKPARPGAMMLALNSYVNKAALPPVPASFGHDGIMPSDWGMLANDQYGCCVWAGAAHETMLWNHEAAKPIVPFTNSDVLSDYSAVTGFDASQTDADGNNPTDQGTDMVQAAEYRRTVGVRDAHGIRHKVATYLSVNPADLSDIWAAAYLFGAVGIGINVPDTAETQFNNGQEWTVVPGAKLVGGHYIPLVGKSGQNLHIVTWGKVQKASLQFIQTYCDEAVAYVSMESLKNNKSPEGFDQAALLADIKRLHGV